jgi:cytochrome P450
MFNTSFDSTSAKTAWHFLHLALNEQVQERLYDEIYAKVQATNGKITPELIDATVLPYLHAVVRESSRLTYPMNLSFICKTLQDLEIHGQIIPAGSMVALDRLSRSLDAEFVDDPFTFRPERFLRDAIIKRCVYIIYVFLTYCIFSSLVTCSCSIFIDLLLFLVIGFCFRPSQINRSFFIHLFTLLLLQ